MVTDRIRLAASSEGTHHGGLEVLWLKGWFRLRSRWSADSRQRSALAERRGRPHLQVPDVEGLLEDVGGVGARRQPPHGGQVSAVAPHGLNDEDAPLGAAGRLLDAVARLRTWAHG